MLTHLALRDFRNFVSLDLDVPGNGLVIVGNNGHGKTNLLESVACLGLMRSFRGARDVDLIRFGASAFHIRAVESEPARFNTVALGFERASKRKRVALDGVEQSRLSTALGALPSVIFSPADVTLVSGGPGERRRYLDVMLALSSAEYLKALQAYRHALVQRNAILNTAHRKGLSRLETEAQISVWEPALAANGALIIAKRSDFVTKHKERYAALCASIGETLPALMRYSGVSEDSTQANTEDSQASSQNAGGVDTQRALLLTAFEQQRQSEIRRGTTLVGPHRHDLLLALGARDVRTFGSAGQQRSAAISLRLLELSVLRESLGYPPLLLLDDPFAELDSGRSARVLDLLDEAGVEQVLLTVPRLEDIPAAFKRLDRRTICEGVLS